MIRFSGKSEVPLLQCRVAADELTLQLDARHVGRSTLVAILGDSHLPPSHLLREMAH